MTQSRYTHCKSCKLKTFMHFHPCNKLIDYPDVCLYCPIVKNKKHLNKKSNKARSMPEILPHSTLKVKKMMKQRNKNGAAIALWVAWKGDKCSPGIVLLLSTRTSGAYKLVVAPLSSWV